MFVLDDGEEVISRAGRARGQSLVEFALVLPILLIIFMGIFDFGRAIYAFNSVSNAAREGLRVAIVNQNSAAIDKEAKIAMTGLPSDATTVTFTSCGAPKIGCLVTVNVQFSWAAITPIIGNIIGTKTIASTSSMPLERVNNQPPTP